MVCFRGNGRQGLLLLKPFLTRREYLWRLWSGSDRSGPNGEAKYLQVSPHIGVMGSSTVPRDYTVHTQHLFVE